MTINDHGNDFVELDAAQPSDVININLGNGNSTAQIEGTSLFSAKIVNVTGGSGFDTLLFDAQGNPIVAYQPNLATRIADGIPAVPAGGIQVAGYNVVAYTGIDLIPGFTGATASAGGPYTISEGKGLTLAGWATPATGSTILSAAWDVTGSGDFSAAFTLMPPTISWAQLVALGLNNPGTYPIALRVYSNSTTVTAYTTLTINAAAPTLTVSAPSSATAGLPYTITFSGQEVPGVSYSITGWTINWGDGTTSTLPADANSASHTYATPGNDTLSVSAIDPYFPAPGATYTPPATVNVGADSISAGGPYTIDAGQSLVLTASAPGSPTFTWNLNGSTISSSANQLTLHWEQLQALGIDEGTYGNVSVTATYSDGVMATSLPTTLTVDPTAPTATFTATAAVLGGTSPTVSFMDPFDPSTAETRLGFTYSFSFPDGSSIVDSSNPRATVPADLLAQPGSFVVDGQISDQDQLSTDYQATVVVADVAPTVSGELNQTIAAGTPFSLSGVTFSDPGYSTPASSWDYSATIAWGDGATSPAVLSVTQGSVGVLTTGTVSGSHLYQPGQTYTVTVTVLDQDGTQGSASFQVTVAAAAVTVAAGPDQSVAVRSMFSLSQTTFTDNEAPDAATATINWGDGSAVQTVPASSLIEPATAGEPGTVAGSHIYGVPGTYTVTVAVTDSFQASASGTFQVDVTDVAPTVMAGSNLGQSPGVPVSLDATFLDPAFPSDNLGLTYSATISWGDGITTPGTVMVTPGGPGVPTTGIVSGTHTYAVHGNDTVTVTVADSLGGQGSGTLSVQDIPPSVAAGSNQTVNQGSPVVVAATFNDPGYEAGATAASYPATIDWGDGTISTGAVTITPGGPGVPTTGTISGSHIYGDQGVYPVTISVADDGGGVGQGSLSATVKDVGPTLARLANMLYVHGQPVNLHETFTEPGIADVDTVLVNWGDGDISNFDGDSMYTNASGVLVPFITEPTASNPVGSIALSHIYQGDGPYTATITITDKDGLTDTVSAVYQAALGVTSITDIAPDPRNTPVSSITVTFNEPITQSTLTAAALTLTDNGSNVPIPASPPLGVTQTGTDTYQISGLDSETAAAGNYVLTVNGTNIDDLAGNSGTGTASTSWLMDTTPPTSMVSFLHPRGTSLTFPVSVTGTDGGSPPSGLASFDIYSSTNTGPWTLWTTVPASSPTANFTGQSNTTYAFYSTATDNAGNTQAYKPQIEASTYVPDLTPPVTQVDNTTGTNPSTVSTTTGTFTLNLTGTDQGGSNLAYFNVFVSVDSGAYQLAAPPLPAGPADASGNVHAIIPYQGLTDGVQHTYAFYSIGIDGAGNTQSAPTTPNLTLTETFATATPSQLQTTSLIVEDGAVERSYVRYLQVDFNESDTQSGGELTQIVNSLKTASPEIQLYQYDLNDDASSKTAVSLSGVTGSVIDHAIELDFGANGLGGSPNTTTADGYYELDIKLPSGAVAVHHFYRLLGDVTGDGTVDENDLNEIAAEINLSNAAGFAPLGADVNGDGTVSALDLTLATRAKGHKLKGGLSLG